MDIENTLKQINKLLVKRGYTVSQRIMGKVAYVNYKNVDPRLDTPPSIVEIRCGLSSVRVEVFYDYILQYNFIVDIPNSMSGKDLRHYLNCIEEYVRIVADRNKHNDHVAPSAPIELINSNCQQSTKLEMEVKYNKEKINVNKP